MVMSGASGDAACRLAALWRRIEDAHYSYLQMDDSPDKLHHKNKLEGYITEYLSIVPHECKFGLSETSKVFARTINELPDFSAYRAGIGWAALARYAGNLLAQPWRKEYRVIRLYSGYYKHEVEANIVGAETLLHAMGYKPIGGGKLALDGPVCPDMAAAISRDALVAQVECQMMTQIWEAVWSAGTRVSWADVFRHRTQRAGSVAAATHDLCQPYSDRSEVYSNIQYPMELNHGSNRFHTSCIEDIRLEEPIQPNIHPYVVPPVMYPPQQIQVPVCSSVPMMTPYGIQYYPVQTPYMVPTPVYAPIKQATTMPVNGYTSVCRFPNVPTGQLIEIETQYENGTDRRRKENSRRNSTSRSGFSEVSLPSLPRSDTQPSLSKAREDGMGTYESWDYVFRNLSSKDDRNRVSPSLDRDSRTLERIDREERRTRYQPTTLDLEDGLQALNLDRTYDEEVYRTAKVNENLMRMKQEQELKKAKHARKAAEEKSKRNIEHVGNPSADGLINNKVSEDKLRLLSKKEVKDRKDVLKQQNSVNGVIPNIADVRKMKKPVKPTAVEAERGSKPTENGFHTSHNSKGSTSSTCNAPTYDLPQQLVVSLDEIDSVRRTPPTSSGDRAQTRPTSHASSNSVTQKDRWQCATCTYLNRSSVQACDMCGKSKKGPEIEPLTSGGRECPACTLVNKRDATQCDACTASLEHCPTYI